ncbi:MAG: branched-chain amino acid ABC transporter permease [Candidatus Fimadaptatus sp.]|jgi:branched-chain amino acid transport system permease protein
MLMQQLINGVALGGLYALTAIGYSLVYGVMELVNFSHGSVYMFGAYAFYIAMELCGAPMWVSVPAALAAAGLMGIVIQRVALTPFARRGLPLVYSLIATIGSSIVIQNAMLLVMGSQTRRFPTVMEGVFVDLWGCRVSALTLLIIGLSIALIAALSLFLRLTRLGQGMRATAQNRFAATLMGIPAGRIVALCFFLGGALAAVAGILASMNYRSVDISVGTSMGVKAFAATVLGGIGSVSGAALGGLLIGVIEVLVAGYINASLRDMAAYVILIAILIVRPCGLLGQRTQRKV